jgi:hypothetical protein
MISQVGIGWKDVIVRVVNHRVNPLFELLAIEVVHGVKNDAQ